MHWIIGIVAILAYLAIGAFICGLMDDEELLGAWVIFWPMCIMILILIHCAEFVHTQGLIVRNFIKKYFNKEK